MIDENAAYEEQKAWEDYFALKAIEEWEQRQIEFDAYDEYIDELAYEDEIGRYDLDSW